MFNAFLADEQVGKFITEGNAFGDIAKFASNAFFIKELRKKVKSVNGVPLIQQEFGGLSIASGQVNRHRMSVRVGGQKGLQSTEKDVLKIHRYRVQTLEA